MKSLWTIVRVNELSGVILLSGLNTSEVVREGFDTPGRLDWVTDRSECTYTQILSRVSKSADKSTMSTHGVTSDRLSGDINIEETIDELGQFLSYVGVHIEMSLVRLLSGVNVESGSQSEIPVLGDSLDLGYLLPPG